MEIDTVFETTINKDKKAFEGLQGLWECTGLLVI